MSNLLRVVATLLLGMSSVDLRCTRGQTVPMPVTVCDLFDNLKAKNRKMVTVTGVVKDAHGYTALMGRECQKSFVTENFKWPTSVVLADSRTLPAGEAAAGFTTDQAGVDRLDHTVSSAPYNSVVWATVTGQLRIKRRYLRAQTNYGTLRTGYGYLGTSPALLVVKRVEEITLKGASK